MSGSNSPHISVRKKIKNVLVTEPGDSVLIPVLQGVVQASSAFAPLHSAARGLLKIIVKVEVWPFSYYSCSI